MVPPPSVHAGNSSVARQLVEQVLIPHSAEKVHVTVGCQLAHLSMYSLPYGAGTDDDKGMA